MILSERRPAPRFGGPPLAAWRAAGAAPGLHLRRGEGLFLRVLADARRKMAMPWALRAVLLACLVLSFQVQSSCAALGESPESPAVKHEREVRRGWLAAWRPRLASTRQLRPTLDALACPARAGRKTRVLTHAHFLPGAGGGRQADGGVRRQHEEEEGAWRGPGAALARAALQRPSRASSRRECRLLRAAQSNACARALAEEGQVDEERRRRER